MKAVLGAPARLNGTLRFLRQVLADVVNFHFPGFGLLCIAILKYLRVYRSRLVISFHGTDVSLPKTVLERWLWQFTLSMAEGISACSRSFAKETSEVFGIAEERISVFHNGVDDKVFSPSAGKRKIFRELPQNYFVSIGSYIPRKGHREYY